MGAHVHASTEPRCGDGRSAAVVVASTSAARGEAEDVSGPLLVEWLRSRGYDCPDPVVVADGDPVGETVRALLEDLPDEARPRIIVTSGGTGLTPDDRTPDVVEPLLDFPVPGVMHALWTAGSATTPTAVLSRGVAGVRGRTFVVTLPGSVGAVRDGIRVLDPLLAHLQSQLENVRDHGSRA